MANGGRLFDTIERDDDEEEWKGEEAPRVRNGAAASPIAPLDAAADTTTLTLTADPSGSTSASTADTASSVRIRAGRPAAATCAPDYSVGSVLPPAGGEARRRKGGNPPAAAAAPSPTHTAAHPTAAGGLPLDAAAGTVAATVDAAPASPAWAHAPDDFYADASATSGGEPEWQQAGRRRTRRTRTNTMIGGAAAHPNGGASMPSTAPTSPALQPVRYGVTAASAAAAADALRMKQLGGEEERAAPLARRGEGRGAPPLPHRLREMDRVVPTLPLLHTNPSFTMGASAEGSATPTGSNFGGGNTASVAAMAGYSGPIARPRTARSSRANSLVQAGGEDDDDRFGAFLTESGEQGGVEAVGELLPPPRLRVGRGGGGGSGSVESSPFSPTRRGGGRTTTTPRGGTAVAAGGEAATRQLNHQQNHHQLGPRDSPPRRVGGGGAADGQQQPGGGGGGGGYISSIPAPLVKQPRRSRASVASEALIESALLHASTAQQHQQQMQRSESDGGGDASGRSVAADSSSSSENGSGSE